MCRASLLALMAAFVVALGPIQVAGAADGVPAPAANHEALKAQLDKAGYDADALNAFLSACGQNCPTDLKAEVEARQKVQDDEETQFKDAHRDAAKLKAYLGSCRFCDFKQEAQDRLATAEKAEHGLTQLREMQDRYEAAVREERAYAAAKGSMSGLHKYLTTCKVCRHRTEALKEVTLLIQRDAPPQR